MDIESNLEEPPICSECEKRFSERDDRICSECEACPMRTKPWALNRYLVLALVVFTFAVLVTVFLFALYFLICNELHVGC